jgi:hypothetical protein
MGTKTMDEVRPRHTLLSAVWDLLRSRGAYVVAALPLLALACSQGTSEPTAPPPEFLPTPAGTDLPAASQPAPDPTEPPNSPEASAEPSPTPAIEVSPPPTLVTPSGPPPKLDVSIASVPLEEVLFDTFDGGSIQLSKASDRDIDGLRDRIRPIYEPRYDDVTGGDWLDDDDRVIGYVSGSGTAFAYPLKILNSHEIVNDVIDGVYVLVTYCPLCGSGLVNDRMLDGQLLVFGNTSALYQSDMVMFDHQTGSYWFQVASEAVVGPLTGKRMKLLPSMTTTWAQWKELHPETRVLSIDLGFYPISLIGNPYARDPFAGYEQSLNRGRFAFRVSEERLDPRLQSGDIVLAVEIGDSHKAYPLTDRPDEVLSDVVAGEEVVVVVRSEGPSGTAFFSEVDGQTLTFSLADGLLRDAETGSTWDDGGRATSGPMAGEQLTPVPSRTAFWFALTVSLPDLELYVP